MKKVNGFTIVEILVVISLLAVVSTFLTEAFVRSLRGGNKAEVVNRLKQNGQSVLDNISNTIRNSDNVVCPQISSDGTSATADTLAVEKKGTYTRFRFIAATSTTNGKIIQDSPVFTTGTLQQFLTDICINTDYSGAALTSMTDTNITTGVSAVNGVFHRNRQAGSKDSVNVSFNLKPAIFAPAVSTENLDPVPFKTTVVLR